MLAGQSGAGLSSPDERLSRHPIRILTAIWALLALAAAWADYAPIHTLKKDFVTFLGAAPTIGAACAPSPSATLDLTAGRLYKCPAGAWELVPGGGGGEASTYSEDFSAVTSVTLVHGLSSQNLLVECYDSSEHKVEPDQIGIGPSTPYSVTVTFFVPQTGRCVVIGGGS